MNEARELTFFVLSKDQQDFDAFIVYAPKHPNIKYIRIADDGKCEGWQAAYIGLIFLSEFEKHPKWDEIKDAIKRCYPLLGSGI